MVLYSTCCNSPYPVAVYCTCRGKCSIASRTVAHAEPPDGGTRRFSLPVSADRHEHLCFLICTQKMKTYLSFCSVSLKLTVAALGNSSSKLFLQRPRRASPTFHCPRVATNDSWFGLDFQPSVQWTYEASCLNVPSTAIGNGCSRRLPGCMMSEDGRGRHLYKWPMRSGR